MKVYLICGLAALTALSVSSDPSQARIRCSDGYQMNPSGPISTPYCQDEYLAQVAREYGLRVSGDALRHSYSLEREACQLANSDPRVHEYCNAVAPPNKCIFFPC